MIEFGVNLTGFGISERTNVMSAKPATSQVCNTQGCQQAIGVPYNNGWGASTSATFNVTSLPASITIRGSCDDWAILWLNGTVIYNPGGCSCGGSCCAGFNVSNSNLLRIGSNTIRFQCNDRCGGGSGGGISATLYYQ